MGKFVSFKKYYSNLKREESLKQSAKRWTLNRTWADRILWKVGTKEPICNFPSRKQVCYTQLNIGEQGAWRDKWYSSYPHLISTWESDAILLVSYLVEMVRSYYAIVQNPCMLKPFVNNVVLVNYDKSRLQLWVPTVHWKLVPNIVTARERAKSCKREH